MGRDPQSWLNAADAEVLAAFEQASQGHSVQGTTGTVHYRSYGWQPGVAGESPPLICIYLHGFKQNLHTFANFIPRVGLPAVAVDLRGHGQSARLHQPYVLLADYLDDLQRVLAVLPRGSRKVLIGHSLGGRLSLIWSALEPGAIAAVALIDCLYCFYPNYDPVEQLRRWLKQTDRPPRPYPTLNLQALQDYFRQQAPGLSDTFAAYLAHHSCRAGGNGSEALAPMVPHWDQGLQRPNPMPFHDELMKRVLQQLDLPILAFQGRVNTTYYEALPVDRPNVKVLAMEGRHQLHWEHPRFLAEQLQQWIQTLGLPPSPNADV